MCIRDRFIMVAGTPPFSRAKPDDPYYKLIVNNRHDTFWAAHARNKPNAAHFFSNEFKNLIDAMLAYNPSQRPSIAEIKSHAWLNGPIPTHSEILQIFTERYKKVEIQSQKAKEKKEAEKVVEQQNAGVTVGHKAQYRDEDEQIERRNQLIEVYKQFPNLKLPRKESVYVPTEDNCGHYLTIPGTVEDTLTEVLLKLTQTKEYDLQLKEDQYKVNASRKTQADIVDFKLKISKVDDKTSCIQLTKTKGSHFEFLNAFKQIRDLLYGLEEEEEVQEN
eukprot:TRINITY_DN5618_c0_g1_i3.p1 TRINITY_DN5618_c0_g1~~TRINITY_DN5618_c0_g1_i3.p1  ORF type:complete len:276 (-),score=60.80 TRINITY_DN5618_c0_g1_i3:213-1040(-)